jgi:TonB family protein
VRKAGFRACYNRSLLSTDPSNQQGELRLLIDVGANGEVTDARAEGGKGLDADLIACLLRRAKSATFLPPEPPGTAMTLSLPLKFEIVRRKSVYR